MLRRSRSGVTTAASFRCGRPYGRDDRRYIRLQTSLDEASDALDDASASNLAALRREAERLIARRSTDLDRLCAALT